MENAEERPDIHGYEERVRRYLALIAESGIPDEDKKALVEFSQVLRAQGLHVGRVIKYLYHLRVCAENITRLSDSVSLKASDPLRSYYEREVASKEGVRGFGKKLKS